MDNIDNMFLTYNAVVAFCCTSEDYIWQNEKDIEYHKREGKPILHIKQSDLNPTWQEIDVEYNPGHSHYPMDLWFGSCWAMWFGEKYYKFIPKESIKSISSIYDRREFANGSIRIILYKNIWDYDLAENRERQWNFRRQAGIDVIAHNLLKNPPVSNKKDASIELFTGNFEHGGTKKISYYYDKDRNIVPKSKAVKCRTYENDAKRNVIRTNVQQLDIDRNM